MNQNPLTTALIVGAGGFIGSALRYLVSISLTRIFATELPIGTITVNVVGCFLIGLLAGATHVATLQGPEVRAFLLLGLLGGFTTFSTFGNETYVLLREGEISFAFLNVLLQLCLGFAAVAIGHRFASALSNS